MNPYRRLDLHHFVAQIQDSLNEWVFYPFFYSESHWIRADHHVTYIQHESGGVADTDSQHLLIQTPWILVNSQYLVVVVA